MNQSSPSTRGSQRGGFSLIELLAVMAIIGIIAAFLIPNLMGSEDQVKAQNTRAFLSQVETWVDVYEQEHGSYPPSSFTDDMKGVANNKVNEGAEMLFLKLFAKDRPAPNLADERLGNSDLDSAKKSQSAFTAPDLFELLDDWQNPIAYIHRQNYGKSFAYTTIDGAVGDVVDGRVQSVKNPATGDPYRKGSYQLISAGPDGIFGPNPDLADENDDITNFKLKQ